MLLSSDVIFLTGRDSEVMRSWREAGEDKILKSMPENGCECLSEWSRIAVKDGLLSVRTTLKDLPLCLYLTW